MIVQAELIKPFTAPDWRIEPVGRVCDSGDLELLGQALRSGRGQVLAAGLLGWLPYTHVLRYRYEDAATDFLVQIDTGDYLIQMD